ncbi:MAG: glycosyltransferase [Anaerolineae bacterium]|nr:glycosyltransferase [Gloeobacterales cyanobacterium ES-bin-313]
MNHVGIFRLDFPSPSETFIREQAAHLRHFQPIFVVRTPMEAFAGISVGEEWQRKWFTLSRSPACFQDQHALKSLQILHAHFGPDAVYALPLAERLNIPLVTTFHGYDATTKDSVFLRSRSVKNWHYLLGRKTLSCKGSLFIAVSKHIKNQLLSKGFPESKIVVHHIGIDVEKFNPKTLPSQERYILSVGRHTAKKGMATLLQAFARITWQFPNVKLIQIGTGGLTESLVALTKELGITKQVRFLGAQPHSEVQKWMRGAEIFVLPSETAPDGDSEGLPMVLGEASASGIPVVSTWHSGIPEIVLHGETGLLSAEKDSVRLADHLALLLSDPGLGKELGRRGREHILDCFDIRKQTAKLEVIYRQLAG